MNVLIIGNGGREHAIAWKVRQSPRVARLFCAPGNPGIGSIATLVDLKATDIEGLARFARQERIDLTIVGPEQPLTAGIVDRFEREGLTIFGPSRAAAELEGSKIFAKEFMTKYGIPTASFRAFTASSRFDAERAINDMPAPIVMKADGLAAGKGVAICETKEQALEALDAMVEQKAFGDAGTNFLIEEFLEGEEASIFVLTDGTHYLLLPPAQDHKRILDNDQGKNTGGMGAYAPAPCVTPGLLEEIERTIIRPTLAGMVREGRPYKGCLYVGLMLTETGPKVVEYNCRFGDPEAQAVLPLIAGDFAETAFACAKGTGLPPSLPLLSCPAVCVVIASGGYPDRYETDKPILGLNALGAEEHVVVFHAGTKLDHRTGDVVTAGGRVVGVTAIGPENDLASTVARAYRAVEKITFDGAYYRSDIGKKGIDRMKRTTSRGNA